MASKYSPYPGDIVDAKLEPGEFVLNRNAVDAVGVDNLKELNDEVAPRFLAQRGKYVPPKVISNQEEGYRLEMYPDTENEKDRYHFSSFGDKHAKRITDWIDEANKKFPITEKNKWGFLPGVDKEKYVEYEEGKDANYHRQKYLHDNQVKHSQMIYNMHKGPKPMKLRRGQEPLHIDLQKAEIPTGEQFNTDDFNSMLGAKKTLDDFFVRQDMVDGSGRTPMDDDYGKVKGLDPRDYIEKKNPKKLSQAEQLLMGIRGADSSDSRFLNQDTPNLKQTFADNPFLALEAMNKKESNIAREQALQLRQERDARMAQEKAEMARKSEEFHKHNSKSVEEWLSAEPKEGPKAPIDPSTGKAFETEEVYNKRIARENIIKQAKAASRQAKVDKASTYSKSKRKRQQMGADRKSWEAYLQDGGYIRHYNEGDAVEPLSISEHNKRSWAMNDYKRRLNKWDNDRKYYNRKWGDEAPVDPSIEWNSSAQSEAPVDSSQIAQKAEELDLSNAKPIPLPKQAGTDAGTSAESVPDPTLPDLADAPKPKPTIQELASQAEGLGEKTVGAVKDFGQKAYQGAGNFLKKAYGRFGGDAWKASKAMNIEADLNADVFDDRDMGDLSVADDLEASNREMAKMLRDDFGEGQGDWEMAKGQGKQRLKDDFETLLGAGVAGAGAAGAYAWDKGKKAVRAGRDWISDDSGYEEDFSKVQSGEAQGSNMQRVGRGVGMLGELLKDASQFQGYEGGDWSKYQRPDPKTQTDVEEVDLATGKKKNQAASVQDMVQFEQQGGPITLEGFIQQSWRNM